MAPERSERVRRLIAYDALFPETVTRASRAATRRNRRFRGRNRIRLALNRIDTMLTQLKDALEDQPEEEDFIALLIANIKDELDNVYRSNSLYVENREI